MKGCNLTEYIKKALCRPATASGAVGIVVWCAGWWLLYNSQKVRRFRLVLWRGSSEFFPLNDGAPMQFVQKPSPNGAGLALVKDRKAARSAEIFRKKRAHFDLSPERRGGSSGLNFFGF